MVDDGEGAARATQERTRAGLLPPALPIPARPPVRNVNELAAAQLTLGQRVADAVASTMGSWRFIIVQSALLCCWIALNTAGVVHFDIFPFILLNLALSFQAAYAAPVIMMSQNRQAAKDRLQADEDYRTNVQAEQEINGIALQFARMTADRWDALLAAQEEQLALLRQLHADLHPPREASR